MKGLFINFEEKNNGCYERVLISFTKEWDNAHDYDIMKNYALKHGRKLKNVLISDITRQKSGHYLECYRDNQRIVGFPDGFVEIGNKLYQNRGSMFILRVEKIMRYHDYGWIDETEIEDIPIFNGDVVDYTPGSPSNFARIEVLR